MVVGYGFVFLGGVIILVLSGKYGFILTDLIKKSYHLIEFEGCVNEVLSPIASHSDIFICKLGKNRQTLKDIAVVYHKCSGLIDRLQKIGVEVIPYNNPISKQYPNDIALNSFFVGNNLVCKISHTAREILVYAQLSGYNIIDTKQGYANCSCVAVSADSVITTDTNIQKLLSNCGVDVLLLTQKDKESILLEGMDCGFIGGCCGRVDDNTLYFTGNINTLPSGDKINNFLSKHGVSHIGLEVDSLESEVKRLFDNHSLIDIGSIINFNIS